MFNKHKIIILLVLSAGAICGITAGSFIALTHDLPQIRSLESFEPSAVTRIYSSDRMLLAELFVEKRDPVPLTNIPYYLKTAIVSIEDKNFYKHSGVNLKSIFRAVIKNIMAGEYIEGASTITQQLAKTLFLTPQKTLMRKIREALLAFQLERRFTKNEILLLYLNQIYFGSGAYGVESAARTFFKKSVKDLNLAECALIAAMPRAPSRYSPLVNKELAVKRRNIVLRQMTKTGIITDSACLEAMQIPFIPIKQKTFSVSAPYFVEYIKKFLESALGSARLYKGGLTVFTTISCKLQQAAEKAAANGLFSLGIRMKQNKINDPAPQCALISIDVQSGGILAMVGGENFSKSPFNRAVVARRQPGSAFKPVVYALAIEQGFPQNMMILDTPVVFKCGKNRTDWKPENFSRTYKGEMTLRYALAVSENIPAVRLIEMLGPASVVSFGHALGIETTLYPNLSLALGTSEVTLINLTSAYAVFPNQGKRIKPFGVIEVQNQKGQIVWRAKPQKTMVMSRAGAAIITNMLEGVINEGTGKKAQILKGPVAGKTGTTNKFKDAIFIGFSPSIATGVWIGLDNSTTLGNGETGARAALPIWIEFMKKAIADKPCQYFDIPDNVKRVYMNSLTGFPASVDSPNATIALFKK